MTHKTLMDCIRCHKMSYCKAHVTGGTWDHTNTDDPCEVDIGEPTDTRFIPTTSRGGKI